MAAAAPVAKRTAAPIDAGFITEVLTSGADLVIAALKQEEVAMHLKAGGHPPDWRTEDTQNEKDR